MFGTRWVAMDTVANGITPVVFYQFKVNLFVSPPLFLEVNEGEGSDKRILGIVLHSAHLYLGFSCVLRYHMSTFIKFSSESRQAMAPEGK